MSVSLAKGRVWARGFLKEGYKDVYKPIFGSPQFPFWFGVQAMWACYVVHRSCRLKPRGVLNWIKKLILAFAVTFAPRELMAMVMRKASPIAHNPVSVGVFGAIFFVVSLCPYDVAYKVINFCYPVLGLLQGYNQTRLFTLILRAKLNLNNVQLVPLAIGFAVLDQVIEFFFRPLFGGVETNMSSPKSIFMTGISMLVFWLGTHENPYTSTIGIYPIQVSALVLGLVLGVFNGVAVFSNSEEEDAEIARQSRRKTAPVTPSKPVTPMKETE